MKSKVINRIETCKKEKIPYLDLSGLGISHLPQEITTLTWLQTLSIADNKIEDIAPLALLPKLHKLSLSHNRIKELTALTHLSKMKFLFLHHNYIDNIEVLRNMPHLKKLVSNHNRIEDITPLQTLKELVYLDIRDNPLKKKESVRQDLPQLIVCYC